MYEDAVCVRFYVCLMDAESQRQGVSDFMQVI